MTWCVEPTHSSETPGSLRCSSQKRFFFGALVSDEGMVALNPLLYEGKTWLESNL